MRCKVFSSIPFGLYPVDASSTLCPSYDYQKRLQTLSNLPWGAKLPPVENHWFRIKRDYSSWEAQREFSTAEVPFESVLTAE